MRQCLTRSGAFLDEAIRPAIIRVAEELSTVLSSPKLFADDTTLPVLDPGRGRTKTGRIWCYAVDDRPWQGPGHPVAAYIYARTAKAAAPPGTWPGSAACFRSTAMTGSNGSPWIARTVR